MNDIIRKRALSQKLAVSECTLWRWVRSGRLPAPIRLGPNTVGWREADIDTWLEQRASEPRK